MEKEKGKSKLPKWLSYLVVFVIGALLGFVLWWKVFGPASEHPFILSTFSFGGTIVDSKASNPVSAAKVTSINKDGLKTDYSLTIVNGVFGYKLLAPSNCPFWFVVAPNDNVTYASSAYYLKTFRSTGSININKVFLRLTTPASAQPAPVFNVCVYNATTEAAITGSVVTITDVTTGQVLASNVTAKADGSVTVAGGFAIGDDINITIANATGDNNYTVSTSQLKSMGTNFSINTYAFVTPTALPAR